MSRDRDEEYYEPGNLHGEDIKKYKKKEDDKSYEYFVVKVRFVAQFYTKCPCECRMRITVSSDTPTCSSQPRGPSD